MSEDKNKPENPSAFPLEYDKFDRDKYCQSGMTLRDYFAAKALNGICSNQTFLINLNAQVDKVAVACYEMADAMLKQREK